MTISTTTTIIIAVIVEFVARIVVMMTPVLSTTLLFLFSRVLSSALDIDQVLRNEYDHPHTQYQKNTTDIFAQDKGPTQKDGDEYAEFND